jgi:hypothetical protein
MPAAKQEGGPQRALTRLFGSVDADALVATIIRAIQGDLPNVARYVSKKSCRVSVWEVFFGGQKLLVEYDKIRKKLQKVAVTT